MFFGCKFLEASAERVLLQKKKNCSCCGIFFFFNKKMLRNRRNRCNSLSEALTVLRCWGLLQIFKFQGVPKSFQVSMTRDSPEWHVVLEWNQKRVFCFVLFWWMLLFNTEMKTNFLIWTLNNRALYLGHRVVMVSQARRLILERKEGRRKFLFAEAFLLCREEGKICYNLCVSCFRDEVGFGQTFWMY